MDVDTLPTHYGSHLPCIEWRPVDLLRGVLSVSVPVDHMSLLGTRVVGGVARVGGAGVGLSRDRQVVKRMSNNRGDGLLGKNE
jgi:hypothetical protein